MRTIYHTRMPRTRTTPSKVRRALMEELRYHDSDFVGDVMLVASELVSNAVRHGRGQISVAISIDRDEVYLEVLDHGDGFSPQDMMSSDGIGLDIVDRLSARWGQERREGATVVWCEMRTPVSAERREALAQ